MESAIALAFQLAILIMSVVVHEVSHGLVANALGDQTAKRAGRLTLNPLAHLDPVGSFLVPLVTFVVPRLLGGSGIIIGWAKPVPFNPRELRVRNEDIGAAAVGAAGPLANIAVAAVFGTAIRLLPAIGPFGPALAEVMAMVALVNIWLAVFNLVPIPPLDGSKVLFALLPERWAGVRFFLEQFGFLILLFFIFNFASQLFPLVRFIFSLFSGQAG